MSLGYADIDSMFAAKGLIGFIAGGQVVYVPAEALSGDDNVKKLVQHVYDRLGQIAKTRSAKDPKIRSLLAAQS